MLTKRAFANISPTSHPERFQGQENKSTCRISTDESSRENQQMSSFSYSRTLFYNQTQEEKVLSRCLSHKIYEMFDMLLSSTKRNFQIIYNTTFFSGFHFGGVLKSYKQEYKDSNFLMLRSKVFPTH